jgi:hypothetical protein
MLVPDPWLQALQATASTTDSRLKALEDRSAQLESKVKVLEERLAASASAPVPAPGVDHVKAPAASRERGRD